MINLMDERYLFVQAWFGGKTDLVAFQLTDDVSPYKDFTNVKAKEDIAEFLTTMDTCTTADQLKHIKADAKVETNTVKKMASMLADTAKEMSNQCKPQPKAKRHKAKATAAQAAGKEEE